MKNHFKTAMVVAALFAANDVRAQNADDVPRTRMVSFGEYRLPVRNKNHSHDDTAMYKLMVTAIDTLLIEFLTEPQFGLANAELRMGGKTLSPDGHQQNDVQVKYNNEIYFLLNSQMLMGDVVRYPVKITSHPDLSKGKVTWFQRPG